MEIVKNEKDGTMMKILSDGRVLKFARMKYRGEFGLFVPDSIHTLHNYMIFFTKKDAITAARKMGWTAKDIHKIGTRFSQVWGIKDSPLDNYFFIGKDGATVIDDEKTG